MTGFEPVGFTRTVILAGGAVGGTMLTAVIMHGLKKWTGEPGPKGWTRTAVLGGGAFFGTVAAHGIIHAIKGGQGQTSLKFVEET